MADHVASILNTVAVGVKISALLDGLAIPPGPGGHDLRQLSKSVSELCSIFEGLAHIIEGSDLAGHFGQGFSVAEVISSKCHEVFEELPTVFEQTCLLSWPTATDPKSFSNMELGFNDARVTYLRTSMRSFEDTLILLSATWMFAGQVAHDRAVCGALFQSPEHRLRYQGLVRLQESHKRNLEDLQGLEMELAKTDNAWSAIGESQGGMDFVKQADAYESSAECSDTLGANDNRPGCQEEEWQQIHSIYNNSESVSAASSKLASWVASLSPEAHDNAANRLNNHLTDDEGSQNLSYGANPLSVTPVLPSTSSKDRPLLSDDIRQVQRWLTSIPPVERRKILELLRWGPLLEGTWTGDLPRVAQGPSAANLTRSDGLASPESRLSGLTLTPDQENSVDSRAGGNRAATEDASTTTSNTAQRRQAEIFKGFRVSIDDPCYKVLPVTLKKYNIDADWRKYALYVVYGDHERCLGLNEKPLILFKQLDREGRKPMFMLRKHAQPVEGYINVVGQGSGQSQDVGTRDMTLSRGVI